MDKFLAPNTLEATAHNHLMYFPFLHPVIILLTLMYHRENYFTWQTDKPSVDEALISGCASYRAFDRYLTGADLFLLPRTRAELESILYASPLIHYVLSSWFFLLFSRRRYSYDAIHNAIAKSRSTLQPGGYSRVRHLLLTRLCPLTRSLQICHRAEDSIRNVLNTGDNLQILLALHHPSDDNVNHDADCQCNTHTITTTWTFHHPPFR